MNDAANEGVVDRTVLDRFARIFISLTLVILIGFVSLLLAVRHRNQAVEGENQLWRPGQIAAVELLTAAVDQQTGVRGFVITGDDRFLEPYTVGRQESTVALATLGTLFADHNEIRALVDNVSGDLLAWQSQIAEPDISAARVDLESARDLVATGEGRGAFDRLRSSLAELSFAIDRRWADSNNQSASAFTTLLVTAIVVGATLILVAVVLLNRSRRWLTQATTLERRLRSTISAVQASLLPAAVPELDNVEVALAYRPASSDADVGGDFYDLNTSQSGLITVSIGDVCGHDIHAAIATGLVRHTINAASQHLIDPAEVLRWANQALISHDTDGRFVSAAHAHLHPPNPDEHAFLDIALAGHPYPIMIPADGRSAFEIGTAGTPLGIRADPTITTTRITLAPGDQLLLYTDGLTENSRPRLGTDDLLTIIDNSRQITAAETQLALMQHYDTLDRRSRHDDVAVVIIQLQPATGPATEPPALSLDPRLQPLQQGPLASSDQ